MGKNKNRWEHYEMGNRNKCYVSCFFTRGDIIMLVGYSYIKHVLLIHIIHSLEKGINVLNLKEIIVLNHY